MAGHPNATAATIAVAIGTIIVWILEEQTRVGDVPTAVEGAIVAVLTALVLIYPGRKAPRRP